MKTIKLLILILVAGMITSTGALAQYDYLGLVGSASPAGWNPNGFPMEQDTENANIFTYRGPLKAGELKIHTQAADWGVGDWIMPDANGQSVSLNSYIITQGDPDNKWMLQEGDKGNYLLTIDLGAQTITFTPLDQYQNLFLLGSATTAGWDIGNGLDMISDESNPEIFRWVGTLSEGTFKIGTVKSFDDGWDWIMPLTADQPLSANDYQIVVAATQDFQWNITVEQAGNYRISVDLTADTIEILAVNSDATLSEITLNTGELSPAFNSVVQEYFVTVDAGITSVEVNGTTTDPDATLDGAGTVDVSSGSGTAVLFVTADDGMTTRTYTVNIDVGASTDATLSSLSVSPGELTPAFNPSVLEYEVLLPEGTISAEVNATANNDAATLAGTGPVDLSSGAGIANIVVTAEDGASTKTYTVNLDVFVQTYYDTLYMIGPATSVNWDIQNPDPMNVDPENETLFTWEDTLMAGQFKIVSFKGSWCQGDEIVPTVDNQVLNATDYEINAACSGNDYKWLVEVPGIYHVEVDLVNETINITLVSAIEVNYDMIYLVGDASPSGWNIAAPEPMVQDPENEFLFTWEGSLSAGALKFSTFAGDWCDGDWLLATTANQLLSDSSYKVFPGCPPESEDFKWMVDAEDAGYYIITVDLENEKILFDRQGGINVENPFNNNGVNVYPNPAIDHITLDLGSYSQAEVMIYSITGKMLVRKSITHSQEVIDLNAEIPSGIIIMKVITADSTEIFRIIMK